MKNENTMCSVLELGISGDSYDLIRNVCEDEGVTVVDKDTMSIILDVYDETIAESPQVSLRIESNVVSLGLDGEGEDTVLRGYIQCGEAATDINQTVEEFSMESGTEDGVTDEADDDKWEEDDYLTFVIAVGDIETEKVERINGVLGTHIAKTAIAFDEGDLVNMTVTRLGEYKLD